MKKFILFTTILSLFINGIYDPDPKGKLVDVKNRGELMGVKGSKW